MTRPCHLGWVLAAWLLLPLWAARADAPTCPSPWAEAMAQPADTFTAIYEEKGRAGIRAFLGEAVFAITGGRLFTGDRAAQCFDLLTDRLRGLSDSASRVALGDLLWFARAYLELWQGDLARAQAFMAESSVRLQAADADGLPQAARSLTAIYFWALLSGIPISAGAPDPEEMLIWMERAALSNPDVFRALFVVRLVGRALPVDKEAAEAYRDKWIAATGQPWSCELPCFSDN